MRSLIAAALLCLSLGAQDPDILKSGAAMPAFSLMGTDGKVHGSKELKGPVVVVFLSTQCPFVRGTEDRINALAKAYAGRVTFVGINSNEFDPVHKEEGLEAMKARVTLKGYAFVYLKDEDQSVIKAYGGICTPDFFLFDAKGNLAYRGRMDDNTSPNPNKPVTKQELKDAMDAVLAGRAPSADQPPSRGCSIKWK